MKTKDLKPGMMVEHKQGRDYPQFTTDMMVLDTQQWQTLPGHLRKLPFRFTAEPAPRGRSYGMTRGIPCAVLVPLTERTDSGEYVKVGDHWRPMLYRPG